MSSNLNILVVDKHCNVLKKTVANNILFDLEPFVSLESQISITTSVTNCDYIFPIINRYLGSKKHYNKIKETDLYRNHSNKFIFYNLDDIPECLYEDKNAIKFTAMPLKSHEENLKHNIIMIPLVEKKFEMLTNENRNKLRDNKRDYDLGFVGAINTSGRCSVRTKRGFIKNFQNNKKYFIEDTTHNTSIFHVRKQGKLENFHFKYMEKLSQFKFGFCPVGQGLNSYRIGECMQVGTVPIIIEHKCLPLESYIDWNSCALIFDSEHDVTIENINELMKNRDYEELRKNAIFNWEKFHRVGNLCKFLYKEFLKIG